jgi:hypothetical protein
MAPTDAPDPTRATLVAILQQLNRVEAMHEGNPSEQALGLSDLQRIFQKFWAVERDGVKVPVALGLLVRNQLVEAAAEGDRPGDGRGATPARYRISAEGKRYLVDAQEKSDRIA